MSWIPMWIVVTVSNKPSFSSTVVVALRDLQRSRSTDWCGKLNVAEEEAYPMYPHMQITILLQVAQEVSKGWKSVCRTESQWDSCWTSSEVS